VKQQRVAAQDLCAAVFHAPAWWLSKSRLLLPPPLPSGSHALQSSASRQKRDSVLYISGSDIGNAAGGKKGQVEIAVQTSSSVTHCSRQFVPKQGQQIEQPGNL